MQSRPPQKRRPLGSSVHARAMGHGASSGVPEAAQNHDTFRFEFEHLRAFGLPHATGQGNGVCDNLRVPVGGTGAAKHWATGDEAATRSCSLSAGVRVTSPTPQPLVVERIFPASRIVPSLRIPPPSPFSILGPENPLVRLLSSFRVTQQACTSRNSVARTPGRPEVPRPRPQST